MLRRRIEISRDPETGAYSAGPWVVEPMQWAGKAAAVRRVMGEVTTLPNGIVVLTGGAQVSRVP